MGIEQRQQLRAFVERMARARCRRSENNLRKKAVKAAFARIRSASPYHDCGENWLLPEAALLWAIWIQSVIDHFDLAKHNLRKIDKDSAKHTAITGFIVKPDGTEVNALELLGVDPRWAHAQILRAVAYQEAA